MNSMTRSKLIAALLNLGMKDWETGRLGGWVDGWMGGWEIERIA
jgi:hypothetical protein